MNEQIKLWLDKEMNEMQEEIQELNKKVMKKVPIWMAIGVGVMIGIGLMAGYGFLYILRVHFLIGCVIAFFIWLCFFIQVKTTSIKSVRKVYEKSLKKIEQGEIDSLVKQLESDKYETITFQNKSDKFPARLLVGEEFWVYFRFPCLTIIKASEVKKIYLRNDTANVSYSVGGRNIHQNVSIGKSLILSCKNNIEESISLGNMEQVEQAKELINKYAKDDKLFDEM